MIQRIAIASVLVAVLLVAASATTTTAAQSTTISSCQTIDSSGTYALSSDLTRSSGTTCIKIDADDVTLRGNGHTISGGTVGVWSEHDDIVVEDVRFRSLTTGVEFDGVSGGEITESDFSGHDTAVSLVSTDGVTVRANTIADSTEGVVLSGSASEVVSNTITDGTGVVLKGSVTGAAVTNNDLADHSTAIEFDDADGGTVSNNDIDDSRVGVLLERTDDATVERNTVTDDDPTIDATGIEVIRSGANRFTDNTVESAEHGVHVHTQSDTNQFSGTEVRDSAGTAVLVSDYAEGNTFDGLSVSNSGKHGVSIEEADDNALTDAVIERNAEAGVQIRRASDNEVRKSTVRNNQRGVVVTSSADGNTVADSTITQNTEEGIRVYRSDESDLSGNTVEDNDVGIRLKTTERGTVSNNDVRSNAEDGILVVSTDRTDFTDNTLVSNGYGGIELSSSRHNSLKGTTARENNHPGIHLDHATGTVLEDVTSSDNRHGIRLTGASDTAIRDAELTDNTFDGLSLSDSDDVLVENVETSDNANAFESATGSTNTSVRSLTLESGTVVSFKGRDVTVNSVPSPPGDPADRANVGRYVNVSTNAPDSALTLSVHYDDSDVRGVEECSLRLWRHGESWNEVSDPNAVDMVANEVTARVERSGIVAPLGRPGSGCTLTEARDITAPGRYTLGKDISVEEAGNGIEIRTSNVTLDGAGHSLTGTEAGDIGVYVNGTGTLANVTVENLTVTDWDTGIEFQRTERSTLDDNTVSNNRRDGIHLFMFSSDNDVRRNDASDNGRHGIHVSARSDDNFLDANTARNNGRNGIFVDIHTEAVWVSHSVVSGNGLTGLYFTGVSDGYALNNTANRNSLAGVFLSASDAELTLTTANDNDEHGILVVGGDSDIDHTLARNNGKWDYYGNGLHALTRAQNMTITDGARLSFTGRNVAFTSASAPASDPSQGASIRPYLNVTDTGRNAFFDANVSYDDADITTANESTLRLWRYDGSWSPLGSSGEVFPVDNRVRGNATAFGVVAPVGAETVPGENPAPNLTVRSADLLPDVSQTGTNATAVVVVENTGNATGTFDAVFVANGTERARKQVDVAPGQTREVTVDARFEASGRYDVSVSGEPAGTLTVKDELNGVPGFGVVNALAALVVASIAAAALRRKRDSGR